MTRLFARARGRVLAVVLLAAPMACVSFGSGRDLAISKDPKRGVLTNVDRARFPEGTYAGTLRDGYPHGSGRFDYNNGNTYEGTFDMGQRDGAGRMVYASGRVVTGTYARDVDPTSGKIQYPQGPVYEGAIKRSTPNGDGMLTRPDGTTIQGTFKGETVNGFGTYATPGAAPYWGPLVNGVPNGQGVCGDALCNMRNGTDDTKGFVDDLAKTRTDKTLTRETDGALETLEKRHKDETDKTSSALRHVQRESQRLLGPDDTCACHLGKPCIILASNEWNERRRECSSILDHRASQACYEKVSHDEKVAEIEYKKRKADEKRRCRDEYAKWLGVKDDPAALAREREASREFEARLARELSEEKEAYAKSRAELQERRRQQLADEEERKRVRAKVEADIKAEREKELERLKKRCSGPSTGPADCACGGVFKLPPSTSKHAVCKA